MKHLTFTKAVKYEAFARIALVGVSGSGKTYSALRLAQSVVDQPKIAVIDTEARSASKYADLFDFSTLELEQFHPNQYVEAIRVAEQAEFNVLIIDSLSHAWFGKEGELELVDRKAQASKSKNSYFAWRDITPLHNRLIDTMLQSHLHLIVTMRSKAEYIVEDINGKQVPKKIGMAPVMRDGIEYEFDIVFDLDYDHNAVVSKTRFQDLNGQVMTPITEETGERIKVWLKGQPRQQPDIDQVLVQKVRKLLTQIATFDPSKTAYLSAFDLMVKKGQTSKGDVVTKTFLEAQAVKYQDELTTYQEAAKVQTEKAVPEPQASEPTLDDLVTHLSQQPTTEKYAVLLETSILPHGTPGELEAILQAWLAGDDGAELEMIEAVHEQIETRLGREQEAAA